MSLQFEKARRKDLGKHRYDPIESFRPLTNRKAHRYLNSPNKPKLPIFQDKILILTVITPTQTLRAIWKRLHNCWGCYEASPELSWMLNLDNTQAGIHLRYNRRYKGWSFRWSKYDFRKAAPHGKGTGAGRSPAIATDKRQDTNHGNVVTNPTTGVAGKDPGSCRGLPIVADGGLVNNAAGLMPVQANF